MIQGRKLQMHINLALYLSLFLSTQAIAVDKSSGEENSTQAQGQTIVLPNTPPFTLSHSALTNCRPPQSTENLERLAKLKYAYYQSLVKEGFSKAEAFEILMNERELFH